jgi:F0F1-type ATP synthase epsilon subunit
MSTPQNPGRKPRAEAVLQNLPPARQADLFSYMEGESEAAGHSYADCIAWLKSDGINVSKQALSKWRDWYYLRLGFQSARDDARTLLQSEAEDGEVVPEDKIQRVGNRLFSMLAIKQRDPKAWASVQVVQQNERRLAQNEVTLAQNDRRIKLLEEREAKTKSVVANAALSPEEKEAAVKQIFGIS